MAEAGVIVVPENVAIYAAIDQQLEFRQGEILSGVLQYRYDPAEGGVEEIAHEFVVLASQDCDLLQDHNAAQAGEAGGLNSVLLYEAHRTTNIRANINGRDIWKRIVQNNDERYHALQAAPADVDALHQGLPDLIVDFRRFFSISIADLKAQLLVQAARRCRLEMPYREQFQARAAFYLQRVGVPEPHNISPVVIAQN